jgi:hypothetical protein
MEQTGIRVVGKDFIGCYGDSPTGALPIASVSLNIFRSGMNEPTRSLECKTLKG